MPGQYPQQPMPPQGYPGAQPGYPQGMPMQPMAPPPGYPSADEKNWALIAHFGGAAGNLFIGCIGFVAPLVAMMGRGATSPTVRAHAVAALNFQIPVSAVAVVLFFLRIVAFSSFSFGLSTLMWLLSLAVAAVGIIFGVIGGIKANEGTLYKYPLNIQIVK
jgi:uncharacterized Tic20 family protein